MVLDSRPPLLLGEYEKEDSLLKTDKLGQYSARMGFTLFFPRDSLSVGNDDLLKLGFSLPLLPLHPNYTNCLKQSSSLDFAI